jgi:hypothetical protein
LPWLASGSQTYPQLTGLRVARRQPQRIHRPPRRAYGLRGSEHTIHTCSWLVPSFTLSLLCQLTILSTEAEKPKGFKVLNTNSIDVPVFPMYSQVVPARGDRCPV